MIFFRIFRDEFFYQLSRVSVWLYLFLLLTFSIGMSQLISTGDGVHPNNSFHITATIIMGSFLWLLMGATVAGEAAARDVKLKIHALIFTAPVRRLNYLGGKFLAAFTINALLVFSLPLGVLLSFYLPGIEREELLPFRPMLYSRVYFLLSLPTVFIVTALQFSFAALSRKPIMSFLASIFLTVFPPLLAVLAENLFGNPDLIKLLDPVGVAGIVGNEMQTWSPLEKNTQIIRLEGMLFWNRILWLLLALGVLVMTCRRYSYGYATSRSWRSRFRRKQFSPTETVPETGILRAPAITAPQVHREFGLTTRLLQTLAIAWASFKKMITNPIGLILVGGLSLGSAIFGDLLMTELGIPIIPTTQEVISYLNPPLNSVNSPWVILPLLIIFYVGELVWLERDHGLAEIADVTPLTSLVLFIGKYLGLVYMLLVWLAILMAGGIGMQLLLDYHHLEIDLYFLSLFALQLPDYLLFGLLTFAVHVIIDQKYIATLVILLIFGIMAFPSQLGLEHSLLIYAAGPRWWYTEMRGFGDSLVPWLWFRLYWTCWTLLLAIAANLLWARGREQSFSMRFLKISDGLKGRTLRFSLVVIGLLGITGSYIFYNTNVLKEYLPASKVLTRKADYEKQYSRYGNRPQPQLTGTRLEVEIFPQQQKLEISGTFSLKNNTAAAIDSIHLGSVPGVKLQEVEFSRKATALTNDQVLGHHIYRLEQPLMPGDSLKLKFKVEDEARGFHHKTNPPLVVKNGTSFTNFDLLPGIGYQRFREISDKELRKKYQLPFRPEIPSLYDLQARKKGFSNDQMTFEAVIGTAKDEIAVAPGRLLKKWTAGNRAYYHYRSATSIGAEFTILSAAYEKREAAWQDVAIHVYYLPEHHKSIDRIVKGAKASLQYYAEHFGPYPFKSLTLVEQAGGGGGASADAGIIYFGEKYALFAPDDGPDGFDLPYYIIAHEVAHQWWGLARLTPAYVEGAGVLIEGLSVYSGMQVLAQNYGPGHLQKYLDYLHASYALPRSLASAPLLQANEDFLYYRKSGLALYALSKYAGKEQVNAALRELLEKRTSGALQLPTTLDLYKELQGVTPDSLHYLLHDLFKENTYWRLKTNKLSARQTVTGDWEVQLEIEARKLVIDAYGNEKEVPMHDWIEIGIFEEGKPQQAPLYLQMHRLDSGVQTLNIRVARKPATGGIDPNHLLLDLRHDDNIKKSGL
ncbi:ABC transporter permease/M1 family aminopeptidase [Salinimicrobium oceani]|uniref:ABC transporter permease n=1 Tax=Salinimicrobium oceani TaxID=2722702 RepID=A0ABX1CYH4_9FLAO|nr:ABC transporter permease [Salinimicrobium oceani]NJW52439.1 ABC transporter permease [Salinimicrobium oceani]